MRQDTTAADERLAEFRNCRHARQIVERAPRRRPPALGGWTLSGLEALVEPHLRAAAESFGTRPLTSWEAGHGRPSLRLSEAPGTQGGYGQTLVFVWPYNIDRHNPWHAAANMRLLAPERANSGIVGQAARAAGWLRTLAESPDEYPLVRRLLQRALSYGMCCPTSTAQPFELMRRFSSPGKLDRWLAKVIRKADAMLLPFHLRVSWHSLGETACHGSLRPRRAALRAAAASALWSCQDPVNDWSHWNPPSRPAHCLHVLQQLVWRRHPELKPKTKDEMIAEAVSPDDSATERLILADMLRDGGQDVEAGQLLASAWPQSEENHDG